MKVAIVKVVLFLGLLAEPCMSDLFKATRIADCDSNEGWESCYNLIIAEAADQGSFSFIK